MVLINVYDKKEDKKIGNSTMNHDSYKWNHDIVQSFGFIPDNPKYVYGIFLLKDAEEAKLSEEEYIFKVTGYKLLLRNTNPATQFDDTANSQWIVF